MTRHETAQNAYDVTLRAIMEREQELYASVVKHIKEPPIDFHALQETVFGIPSNAVDPTATEWLHVTTQKPSAYPDHIRNVFDTTQSLQAQLYSAQLEADRLRTELANIKTQRLSSTWEHLPDEAALLSPLPPATTLTPTKAPIPLRALQHARQPIGLLTERP